MLFGKHINRYYLKYALVLLLGILALVVVDYMQLKVPVFYGYVVNGVNAVVDETNPQNLIEVNGNKVPFDVTFLFKEICYPLFWVILCMVVCRFLWRMCFFGSGIKVETDLRSRMFDRLKGLSQNYYQRSKVGDLMSLFTNDLETVQDCFGSGILMLCDALFLGSMALVKMWNMNKVLTGFTLIPMSLLLCASMILSRYLTKRWKTRQEAFSALSDFSQESFSGIAVIKAFVKETKELIAFRKLNKQNEDANVNYTRLSTKMNITITLLVESVICIIFGYGGSLVLNGRFNAGELVEFIGYFTSIIWPIMAVSQLIEMRSRGRASLNRISELLDEEADVVDRADVKDVDDIAGNIEFRDLTFRYPGADRDTLTNVTFTINAGENVGIVGKTGCGKTTLVDLILRTYNVPDGTVFLDGHDVNTIPIRTVRKFAAYVPQDNFLFSDTISNNISFASDSDDADEIRKAAELSDVHDNIMEFSKQYETVLG
ncbi:MAG: hypothetical protein CW338_10730, partial [Clostridiales bacterium]|nr:hypothetical protein [Clostridiales bacterium]